MDIAAGFAHVPLSLTQVEKEHPDSTPMALDMPRKAMTVVIRDVAERMLENGI